jgi:hypothetical protein
MRRKGGAALAGLVLVGLLVGSAADGWRIAPAPSADRGPNAPTLPAEAPAVVGLTVRYLDAHGRIVTLPVERFRR